MTTTSSIHTVEQLIAAGDIGRCELVRGELKTMSPAGSRHGRIGMRLATKLSSYILEHQLGEPYLAETGFILSRNPDTVRAPDFAFISNATLKEKPDPERGFRRGSPDLAMEVISPDDSATEEVGGKVMDWLAGGAQIVLVVDPRACTMTVYRADHTAVLLRMEDQLRLEPLLPGLSLTVREVFSSEPR
jgi:Uma2 family endonuclease